MIVAAALVLALGLAAAVVVVLRPHLAPWGVIFLFGLTAELKLRVGNEVGVLKDLLVVLLVGALVLAVLRARVGSATFRPPLLVWSPLVVLSLLYVLDLGGHHGSGWLVGTRLLLEPLILLAAGVALPRPDLALRHLTRAMVVFSPLQAALAWVQQYVGADNLVYQWGYAFGRQVRLTSGGALRSSGTFEEAFSLSAFAVLVIAVAATIASRKQAVVLVLSAVAILGATQVRTAVLEIAVISFLLLLQRASVRAALATAVAVIASGLVAAGFYLRSSPDAAGNSAPLLLDLNGRTTAWEVAYRGVESLVRGNGVGTYGVGSDREGGLIAEVPTYNPGVDATALLPGDPRFIDSTWLQVLSDVGLVGVICLLVWGVSHLRWFSGPARSGVPAAWLGLAVLLTAAVDWMARTTLGAFPTGFMTMYVLGIATAAATQARPRLGQRLILKAAS